MADHREALAGAEAVCASDDDDSDVGDPLKAEEAEENGAVKVILVQMPVFFLCFHVFNIFFLLILLLSLLLLLLLFPLFFFFVFVFLSLFRNDQSVLSHFQCDYYAGNLSKWTNYLHGWQDRYIVLRDGTLSYYKR